MRPHIRRSCRHCESQLRDRALKVIAGCTSFAERAMDGGLIAHMRARVLEHLLGGFGALLRNEQRREHGVRIEVCIVETDGFAELVLCRRGLVDGHERLREPKVHTRVASVLVHQRVERRPRVARLIERDGRHRESDRRVEIVGVRAPGGLEPR